MTEELAPEGKPKLVAVMIASPIGDAFKLHVKHVIPDPSQPRKTITPDSLNGLARSLIETGQIHPIVVRPAPEGQYVIVTGERRWRAAKEAGLQYIDCVVRRDLDDRKVREMQLAENYQRDDITPLEQAEAFEAYLKEHDVSQSELSRRTGIPQRTISARLALLELSPSMRASVEAGEIGPHEALKISKLPATQQEPVAEAVASGKVGGRMLEELFGRIRANPQKPTDIVVSEFISAATSPPRPPLGKTANVVGKKGKLNTANSPLELDILLASANEAGSLRQKACHYLSGEGICRSRVWESRESIPRGIGNPVKYKGNWYVKPSLLLCAVCTNGLDARLNAAEDKLEKHPLSGLEEEFKCSCGGSGKLAVTMKCTKCGKQAWWDWWPEAPSQNCWQESVSTKLRNNNSK